MGTTPTPSLSTPGVLPNASGAVPIQPRQPGWDPYDPRGGSLMPPGGYMGSSMNNPGYAAPTYSPPPASYSPPPGYAAPPAGYTAPPPSYSPPPGYGAPPATYNPPAGYGAQPYGAQPYTAQPYGAQPNYGAPPPGAYGNFTAPYGGGPYGGSPYYDGYVVPKPRRFQHFSFDYTWLPGDDGADMDIDDFNLRASFAFPFFYSQQPLVITPAFGMHLWSGPQNVPLPAQVYDATLDFAWKPQFGELFAMDLGITPGVFSDFNGVQSEAFRIQGRAVGILTVSPRLQAVFGVVYLDRLHVKILPVVGAVWTPNEDTRFEIVFPRPKLAQRLTNVGNTEWWWYVAGEYGGNSYAINESVETEVDYADLRLIMGLEWRSFQGPQGLIEVGYVFNRELEFLGGLPNIDVNDTVMLRAGITY